MLKSLYIKLSSSYSSLSAPVKASFWFYGAQYKMWHGQNVGRST